MRNTTRSIVRGRLRRLVRSLVPNLFNDEPGQVLPFVAVVFVMLLGMAGLAIDVGHVFYCNRALQGYADAAALAGGGSMRTAATSAAVIAASNSVQCRSRFGERACVSTQCNHGDRLPRVEMPDHSAKPGNRVRGRRPLQRPPGEGAGGCAHVLRRIVWNRHHDCDRECDRRLERRSGDPLQRSGPRRYHPVDALSRRRLRQYADRMRDERGPGSAQKSQPLCGQPG